MQQFWQFLAGIGMFLLAMHLMEISIKSLSGRTFKLFLRKHTNNTAEAIGSGALVTGILQSSSVVIMTVLTFVGAGIMSMRNALAVTIGSNFGTTLDSWMVATLGFKVEIDVIALPLVSIGALVMTFTGEEKKLYRLAQFVMGFGFLFLGLGYMKDSMSTFFEQFDFAPFADSPRILFVGIGFVITGIIQSSSATMAILLSALNTGALPFEAAVAAVIGSELATTVKLVVGSIKGNNSKMQLAVGNVVFNVVITAIAFSFMDSFMALGEKIVGKDPLLQLVVFQSMINLAGVILFIPVLNLYARLLEKYIRGKERSSTFVIDRKLIATHDLAFDSFTQDVELLLHRVLRLNLEAFGTEKNLIHSGKEINTTLEERNKRLSSYEKKYDDMKQAEGELLIYGLELKKQYPEESQRIDELVTAARHTMHSAKAMKDVRHNRIEFHESADEVKYRHYTEFRIQLEEYYREIDHLLQRRKNDREEKCAQLVHEAETGYFERQEKIYEAASRKKLSPTDVSSLLNVNREVYTSCKTIVQSILLFSGETKKAIAGDIP